MGIQKRIGTAIAGYGVAEMNENSLTLGKERQPMGQKQHIIPLGVGFYPDWFYNHYGISFDQKYYFDPETRIEARMAIDRALYERFGDVGLGDPDPKPRPLITFGMVMLPAVFGCEIVFERDALPWAMPLNLSRDQIMKLDPPDIFESAPMKQMIKQIEYLKDKYGTVVGDINTTGVQNLALKIRGDQLYIDYFEDPELCHHLLGICAKAIVELFKFNKKVSGTGAVDVTPMCDPRLCVLPNCTIEQISLNTYEKYVLQYDNYVAEACAPVGIHHCGSVDEVLEGYSKVRHLKFIEIGFGSDVRRTREIFGPNVAVNARINPVLMKNGSPEEVAAEVRRLIDNGDPLENFSIDTVGLTYGTPDENVKVALRTAAEYGKIHKNRSAGRKKFHLYSQQTVSLGTALSQAVTILRSQSREVAIGSHQPFIVIGERINPTGRPALAEAIRKGNMQALQSEALAQARAGAHVLDVNVGISGIDEPEALRTAVLAIQQVTDLPLCIDSANPRALKAALEVYNGTPLINSVNGEIDKLASVLPLAKEFNAPVIGLTMDEKGIPAQAEDRLKIASLIVEEAEKYGISRDNIIIDPLAMAVSADHEAGIQTIRALQLIGQELGVNLTLGLSNISFGLPDRQVINTIFLAMCAVAGLNCAIIDPTNMRMRKALLAIEMLQGKDQYCQRYLAQYKKDFSAGTSRHEIKQENLGAQLTSAVVAGKRKEAGALVQELLDQGAAAEQIINENLIPALDIVGDKFEQRKIFIPEMMMAAKSVQACMDILRPLIKKESSGTDLGTVVLGTVFGDLHDIGKNLVKLLLETSGFRVVDLGENVAPERFVEAAREHKAQIVGLSSLLTTGDPYVEKTIATIRESDIGSKVKVICGGAAVTPKFVERCGADAYAKDAAEGVKKVRKLLGISEGS